MKILYVSISSPWPVDAGYKVRMDGICRGLSRHHDLAYAFAGDSPIVRRECAQGAGNTYVLSREPATRRQKLLAKMRPSYGIYLSPREHNAFRKSFLRLCAELDPDAVCFFQSATFWRVGPPPAGIPLIFDLDDLESKKNRRFAQSRSLFSRLWIAADGVRIRRMERDILNASQVVLLSNPDDLPHVSSVTAASTVVVPNGFDFPEKLDTESRQSHRLVLFGYMTYRPTREGLMWFLDRVWPMITRAYPEARIDVAGRYPSQMEALRSLRGVMLHGFLEELDLLLDECAFLVVPVHVGAGTRIKILEAWSKGLPVVTTTIGCEGLGAVDGETVLIGDTPKEFAGRCIELLDRPELGAELAERAFQHGRANFDWEYIFPRIDEAVGLATVRGRLPV